MTLTFDNFHKRTDPDGIIYLDIYMSMVFPENNRLGLKFSIASTGSISDQNGDIIYHDVTLLLKDNTV